MKTDYKVNPETLELEPVKADKTVKRQAAIEIDPAEFGQIVRSMPESKNDFLRWQVGRIEMRPMMEFIMDGGGYRKTTQMVQVFRLLGFGSTLAKAKRMAANIVIWGESPKSARIPTKRAP